MSESNKKTNNEGKRADESISETAGIHVPSTDELSGLWKQQAGNAKLLWGKITDDELLKTEGRLEHLTGLVQERYALTRDVAEKQVKEFLAQSKK